MKKVLKGALIFFVVLVVLGAIAGGGKKSEQAKKQDPIESTNIANTNDASEKENNKKSGKKSILAGASEGKDSESGPTKEVYKTTAKQLYQDYEANEVAADEKMKGKLIEVSGVIESIDKDAFDNIVLHLKTGNSFAAAMITLKDSEKDAAIKLKKGNKITVICTSMLRLLSSPNGRKCTIN